MTCHKQGLAEVPGHYFLFFPDGGQVYVCIPAKQ